MTAHNNVKEIWILFLYLQRVLLSFLNDLQQLLMTSKKEKPINIPSVPPTEPTIPMKSYIRYSFETDTLYGRANLAFMTNDEFDVCETDLSFRNQLFLCILQSDTVWDTFLPSFLDRFGNTIHSKFLFLKFHFHMIQRCLNQLFQLMKLILEYIEHLSFWFHWQNIHNMTENCILNLASIVTVWREA